MKTKITVTVEVNGLCAKCHKERIKELRQHMRAHIVKQIKELEKELKCEHCGEEAGTNPDCSYCSQYAEAMTIGEYRK